MQKYEKSQLKDEQTVSSAVSAWTGVAGIFGLLAALIVVYIVRPGYTIAWLVLMGSATVPMLFAEYYRNRQWKSTATAPGSFTCQQILGWKIRGLLFAGLIWVVTLAVFQFANMAVTATLLEFLPWLGPLLLGYLFFYLIRVRSEDWESGTLLSLGYALDQQGYRWGVWKDTARNHLIKAFFLPLMIDASYLWLVMFYHDLERGFQIAWYFVPMALLYLIDTVYATIGYMCNSHRLDTHIRSSNPYLLAWVAALVCYPPLMFLRENAGLMLYTQNGSGTGGAPWMVWFERGSPLFYSWGAVIVALTVIYAWATVIFGIRFSNLTNRGIITNGPYRYFKHPAYLAKNLSWWFLYVPFLSMASGWHTLQMVGALFVTNMIYWCRAKTEEWHLMQDPQYQAYSKWIARNGLFARVKKLFQ